MAKKVRSVKNFWGGNTHRDTHGKKVGETRKSFWGDTKTDLDRCINSGIFNDIITTRVVLSEKY